VTLANGQVEIISMGGYGDTEDIIYIYNVNSDTYGWFKIFKQHFYIQSTKFYNALLL